jgi:hypothetical protein
MNDLLGETMSPCENCGLLAFFLLDGLCVDCYIYNNGTAALDRVGLELFWEALEKNEIAENFGADVEIRRWSDFVRAFNPKPIGRLSTRGELISPEGELIGSKGRTSSRGRTSPME